MSLTANWNYPTSIRFGVGRIAELADICRSQGIERPLLVTDSGLARAPMTIATLEALGAAGLGVTLFCDLKPNPVEANLAGGLDAWRAGNHDGVIAFGGGSGLDMGKLIAFMSGQTRPIRLSSATTGPVPMKAGSPRSLQCRLRRARGRKWAVQR